MQRNFYRLIVLDSIKANSIDTVKHKDYKDTKILIN